MSDDTEACDVSDSPDYSVGNSRRVLLEVLYGDLGLGGTSVLWNGEVLDVTPGEPLILTNGGDPVSGGVLNCNTNVQSASVTTHTSVTYQFRGGDQDKEYPYNHRVESPGDIARYCINFFFV